jgi:hypothetical protein
MCLENSEVATELRRAIRLYEATRQQATDAPSRVAYARTCEALRIALAEFEPSKAKRGLYLGENAPIGG